MAELVDALASGASARKGVEVQVLLSAPKIEPTFTVGFIFGVKRHRIFTRRRRSDL